MSEAEDQAAEIQERAHATLENYRADIQRLAVGHFDGSDHERTVIQMMACVVLADMAKHQADAST